MKYRLKPIISVEEARKLLGTDANNMTDEQVAQLVDDMDVIAQYSLDMAVKQRKEDGQLLARLIYDIYKERLHNPDNRKVID